MEEAWAKPAAHEAKAALVQLLRERHGEIAKFNAAWGLKVDSFEAIGAMAKMPAAKTAAAEADCRAYLALVAERYFGVTCRAIRAVDPNHMIIGSRFAGRAPDEVWQAAGRHVDVVSVNQYERVDLETGTCSPAREALDEWHGLCGRPMMLTEWSFPALDSGLPCVHGAGQRFDTQTQRAAAYAIYQSMLFETPYMVGSNFFMWVDEPALGISSTFPEDSNYGLVNEQGVPWPELTATAAKINRRAVAYHSGQTVAVSASIDEASGKITLRNAGRIAAESCPLAVWIGGERRDVQVKIAAGGEAVLDLLKGAEPGPHFVVVQVDPERVLPDIARRDHLVAAHVWIGPKADGEVAVIGNGSDRLLRSVSVDGRAVVDELPPRSMRVVKLAPVVEPVFEDVSGPFVIDNGVLKLTKREGGGDLIDDVSLGGVPLGRVVAVIHQGGVDAGHNLWLHANRIVSIRRAVTPTETVLEFTVEYHPPSPEQGGAWRAVYELRIPRGSPTFTSRVKSITNIATKAWRLAAYYHYLPGHLGGDKAGDVPVAGKVPNYYGLRSGWKDPTAGGRGAAYGAFAPEPMRCWFWLDEHGHQHPDISRDIDTTLAPGETWTCDDPPATVFGVIGDVEHKPWTDIAADIAARRRCIVKIWR